MRWRMRVQDSLGRWNWETYEPKTLGDVVDLAIEVARDHRHLAPLFLGAYVESIGRPFAGQAPSTYVAMENLHMGFGKMDEDALFREVFGSLYDARERLDYWGK